MPADVSFHSAGISLLSIQKHEKHVTFQLIDTPPASQYNLLHK